MTHEATHQGFAVGEFVEWQEAGERTLGSVAGSECEGEVVMITVISRAAEYPRPVRVNKRFVGRWIPESGDYVSAMPIDIVAKRVRGEWRSDGHVYSCDPACEVDPSTLRPAPRAFVPKEGARVRVVEVHPHYTQDLRVGMKFVIANGGPGSAGAWEAKDPSWCVIKSEGRIGICRVEVVEGFQVGDWVEWDRAGERRVGQLTVLGASNYYCLVQPLEADAESPWSSTRLRDLRPWQPQPGEWCEGDGVASGEPYSGSFSMLEEYSGKPGARLDVSRNVSLSGTVVVARASLRPAPVPAAPGSAGSMDTAPRTGIAGKDAEEAPAESDATVSVSTQPTEPGQPILASVPGKPLYYPKEGEWVRVVEVRAGQRPKPRFGRGDVVRVDQAGEREPKPDDGPWLTLWESVQGDPPNGVLCRVVPADALDRVLARRVERQRWRTCAWKLKQGLPEGKRAPHDWEPPGDFEVCK
ncbi:MAG TPA: hypothetical protein VGB13_04530 [Candidatus Krumholzibacteria bacterium]